MKKWITIAAALPIYALATSVKAQVLYDGSTDSAISTRGYLDYYTIPGIAATSTPSAGEITLDTTGTMLDAAGYSNYFPPPSLSTPPTIVNTAFPALNSTTGFEVSFTAKIDSENHSSTNRAGFSAIVLDSNHVGIELGFWDTDIWAQTSSPLFTHSSTEDASFNTTNAFHKYDLFIKNGTYQLFADGNDILNGATQDYSAIGIPPYNVPNFIYLGDDTTAADAKAEIENIALPEPATAALGLGIVGFLLRGRPKRR